LKWGKCDGLDARGRLQLITEFVDCLPRRIALLTWSFALHAYQFVFKLQYLYRQNRRQKAFHRGLCVCAGGLGIVKIDKTPLIYSVSCLSLGGLELCVEG